MRPLIFSRKRIYFAESAINATCPPEVTATFVKTAILYFAFSLEATANALTDSLNFSNKVARGFDSLPPLGKFQVFYLHKNWSSEFPARVLRSSRRG